MDITQNFYNKLASQYHKLFLDWQVSTQEQAEILDKLFADNRFDKSAHILDCACGIGTQAIGLANKGYNVTASDVSDNALTKARENARENNVQIQFVNADFRTLSKAFSKQFDIIICMDNALPHMLTKSELENAINSIANQIKNGGMFVASIRDYDELLENKPTYSPPYIHKTDKGQRVSFQTWNWVGKRYKLTQYIIDDEETLQINKFNCEYRATRRQELTNLLIANGCSKVTWKLPNETGFYQPIVIAIKD